MKIISKITNNNKQIYMVLLLFVILYITHLIKYFWTLPTPSDPLQYLGSAAWGTTYGYWPWLDRISLAVNLKLFTIFFSKIYIAGMVYIGFINSLILSISMLWAFKKSGIWASLLIGLFINSSYLMLGWGTYLYPDQTVALYCLISFFFYFSNIKEKKYFNSILISGIFASLATLTKATGIMAPLFFLGHIIYKKDWKKLKQFITGMILGTIIIVLLFISLYNWQSFVNVYNQFFFGNNGLISNINAINNPHYGTNAGYFYKTLLSIKYFPLIALFIVVKAYKKEKTRNLFLFAWGNIIIISILKANGPAIPSYIYTAYVFTCLGLAIYLSDLIKNTTKNE
ncbi:hypothetical protein ISS06_01990 [Patescibacteria group bacterium]|nr:hypothetical protein [Patescibacteria group bacterium]